MSTKKSKKRLRLNPKFTSKEPVVQADPRVQELEEQLAQANARAEAAMAARDHSEAKLAELEDILEFTAERADSVEYSMDERTAEVQAALDHSEAKLAELEDILEFTAERADSAEFFADDVADSAQLLQRLTLQCHDLEAELVTARDEAETARRILHEFEGLAEDAEERAYRAEHDLWLAEQRFHEATSQRLAVSGEAGPLNDVLKGLVERQMLGITLDLAVKQGARHRRKVALLSVGHIGAWDVAALQPVIAQRLSKIVRDSDMLGRLDDETFGILVSEQTDIEEIRFIATCIGRRAESVFAGPVVVKGHPHYLRVAIGVSIFPDDAPTGSIVMAHSETALSEARLISKVGLNFYSDKL